MLGVVSAHAQGPYPAVAAYIGAGSPVKWTPWTSAAAFGALPYTPPTSVALYCQATSTSPWTPCAPGGGGGSGTVTSVTITGANGIGTSGCVITTSGTCALSLGAITPTSVAATGPVTSGPDGTHAGLIGVYGNTVNPSIPSNELGFLGPTSASFTSIFYQLSATAPTAGQVMAFSAPVANVSTQTWVSGGAAATFWNSPQTLGANSGIGFGANNSNQIEGFGFTPEISVTFSNIYASANTVDATNLYSMSIVNSSGTLVCHLTTGIHIPASGTFAFACSEGVVTLAAGSTYVLLTTSNAGGVGKVNGGQIMAMSPFYAASVSGCSSSAGVISGTCTISLSPSGASFPPAFLLH